MLESILSVVLNLHLHFLQGDVLIDVFSFKIIYCIKCIQWNWFEINVALIVFFNFDDDSQSK